MPTKTDDELRRIVRNCCEEAHAAGELSVRNARRQDRLSGRLRALRGEVKGELRRLRAAVDALVGMRTDKH